MGELLALVAGICFALSTMLSQRGMRRASASAGVMISLLMNNLIFGMSFLVVFNRGALPPVNMGGVLFAAGAGLAGNVLGRTLNFQAVRRIGSARTILLSLTQTLFVFIWGVVLLGEVLTYSALAGIALVVLGIYWLSREQVRLQDQIAVTGENVRHIRKRWASPGIILALTAGFAYSLADLLRKMSLKQLPSAIVASALGGVAALIVQSVIFSTQGGWKELRRLDRASLLNLVLSGTAGGCAILSLNAALSHSPIVVVNTLYNIRVWFAIALGPLLLGTEGRITRVLAGSAVLVVAGTLIIISS